ncbi:MAG TPA: SdrD B-like domain-containing protein [Sulfurovum sp.]
MELVNTYYRLNKKSKALKRLLFGILLLSTSVFVQAGVLKLDLQGCKSSADNDYHPVIVPDIHDEHADFTMYFCNDASYTEGNLKYWSELDMVPHRITFSNTTGSTQSFTFRVGGDYKDANDPNIVGWDYVTELTLDVNATRALAIQDGLNPDTVEQECKTIGAASDQNIVITNDESEIFREVVVASYPNDLTCVAIYNMRLAIGSSNYSGSSLQSRLISVASSVNLGDQTLPVPDVQSTTFSKTMAATQGGSRTWTVTKSSSPASINIENTCSNEPLDLQKDVNITVSWTKGPVTPAGNVDITTVIQASNTAHRAITIDVNDTLYSGTTELATHDCPAFTLQPNVGNQIVCTIHYEIPEENGINLNDLAVATYSDPDHPDINYTGTKVATATAFVQGTGENEDENATIQDIESISGSNLSYSVDQPSLGIFVGYNAGDITTDDVNWTSGVVLDTGSVTFNKTIYAVANTSSSGALSDVASLKTGGGTGTNSGTFTVNLSSSKLVSLTIEKDMDPGDIRPEGVDFNFTVRNGVGYNNTVTLSLTQDEPSASITLSNLDPTQYNIQELPAFGYAPVGSSTRIVNLTSLCAATVTYTNVLADRPAVRVKKITYPPGFEDGWEMTISKLDDNNLTWTEINSTTTIDDGWHTLIGKNNLLAGTYKIEETLQEGWFEVARATDCNFTYDPNVDGNRSDYECIISNAQYSTIIINKDVEGDATGVDFNFTQNINSSVVLSLNDGDSYSFDNVRFGTYRVTENDPAPNYLLSNLVCEETDGLENSVTDLLIRRATINLEPGETVECTFTNQEKGRVNVVKLEDSGPTSELWTFTIEGPEGIMERDTSSGTLNFEDARLVPGTVYTLCEINVHPLWDAEWTHNSAVVDPELIVDGTTVDRCYDFTVGVGETAAFEINNISPTGAVHIGNYAWYDDDNNGIQDQGEDPVVGLRVELLDENGTSITDLYGKSWVETNTTGGYDFYVTDGSYRIRFSGLPANYIFSPKNSGNPDEDSDANSNGVTDIINVSGASRFDIDAGIYCICNDVESSSDGSPALNTITAALMMLLTLIIGLFFVRKEELRRNER